MCFCFEVRKTQHCHHLNLCKLLVLIQFIPCTRSFTMPLAFGIESRRSMGVPLSRSFSFPVESIPLDTSEDSELVAQQSLSLPLPCTYRCISLYWSKATNPIVRQESPFSLPHSPDGSLDLQDNIVRLKSRTFCLHHDLEIPRNISSYLASHCSSE